MDSITRKLDQLDAIDESIERLEEALEVLWFERDELNEEVERLQALDGVGWDGEYAGDGNFTHIDDNDRRW